MLFELHRFLRAPIIFGWMLSMTVCESVQRAPAPQTWYQRAATPKPVNFGAKTPKRRRLSVVNRRFQIWNARPLAVD